VRRMRRAANSTPRPDPSVPQLLLTISNARAPCSSKALISTSGTPTKPNPPTASEAPFGMSATACAAVGTTCRSRPAGDGVQRAAPARRRVFRLRWPGAMFNTRISVRGANRVSSTPGQLLPAGGRFRRVGVLRHIVRNANPTMESGSAMRRSESAPAPSPEFVQSLGRGLAVIRAFDAQHRRLTLTEVAKLTDLTRATARRFLLTLVELGYVASDGSVFWLTPQVLRLGYSYLSSLSLNQIATPHIEALVRQVGESSSMAILDDDGIVYVARVPVSRIMTVFITVGTRFPAYATSMGPGTSRRAHR